MKTVAVFVVFVLLALPVTLMAVPQAGVTDEAKAKIAAQDHKKLVDYAARILRSIAGHEKEIAALRKTLQRIEAGKIRPNEIPGSGCAACVTFSTTTSLNRWDVFTNPNTHADFRTDTGTLAVYDSTANVLTFTDN